MKFSGKLQHGLGDLFLKKVGKLQSAARENQDGV